MKEKGPRERFRLVARLTNKSDDKICILVALLSPLLDPGLRLRRPFHVAPYLRYSFAFPPPALHITSLSLSPSPSAESQTPILTTSFPTLSTGARWKEAESTREKHGEFSDGAAKESRKPSKCRRHDRKPIGRIRKSLDRCYYVFIGMNYNVHVSRV